MKALKFILRILVTIVVGIPTLWILYLAFTFFGLLLVIPIIGIFSLPFNWLINNKEGIKENIEMIISGLGLMVAPFVFWYLFIIGENPWDKFNG